MYSSGFAFGDAAVTGDSGVIDVATSKHEIQRPIPVASPTDHTATGGSPTPPPCTPGAILDPQLRFDSTTQQMCIYLGSTCGDPNSPAALNAEMQTFILLRQHPFCPNSPMRTAPPATSPAQLALLIWQTQIPLPHPAPYIAPGYAITGKRAYLEIRDNPSLSPQHFNELGYDITVEATSTYDVVWGDTDRRRIVNGKLTPVGNTVDVATATWTNTIGDPELVTVWKDPDFDPIRDDPKFASAIAGKTGAASSSS